MSNTPINYRSARYVEGGCIDCEIEHPRLGWIPFTLDPTDTAAGIDVVNLHARMLKSGNIAPYSPAPQRVEHTLALLTAAVQAHLDTAAQAAGYDNIYTAVTYADEPAVPKFQAEGRAFRAWRSLVWAHCYQVLADVQAGTRAIPTAAQLIAELPALDLPPANLPG